MVINVYSDNVQKHFELVNDANKIAMNEKLEILFHPIRNDEEFHQKKYEYLLWIGKKNDNYPCDLVIRYGSGKKLVNAGKKLLRKRSNVNKGVNYHEHLIIAVIENKDISMSLADSYANKLDYSTILVDADRLMPHYDSLVKSTNPTKGLRACLINLQSKSSKTMKIKSFTQGNLSYGNIDFLTSSPHLFSYEVDFNEEFNCLLQLANLQYDRTIIRISKFIYDTFTLLTLIRSDIIIVPINSDLELIRNFQHMFDYISEKQNVQLSKVRYVGYNDVKVPASIFLNLENHWLGNYDTSKKASWSLTNDIEKMKR